jgi:uncharacterized protein (TIGR02001 family)
MHAQRLLTNQDGSLFEMKMTKLSLACGVAMLGASAIAQAEFSANVSLVSDYVFRGFSQTLSAPAIQGGFDYSHDSGFYAGVWASNVSEYWYGSSLELDTYIGYATEIGGIGLDFNANRYNYPSSMYDDVNTNEFSVTVSKDFEVAAVSVKAAYSPEFYGPDHATYYGLGLDVPAGPVTVSGSYGIQKFEHGDDIADWSVGVSGDAMGVTLGLAYTNTDYDHNDCDDTCDGRVVASVSKSF